MKAMYGVNSKGEMTPCHAKNPKTCRYHVNHQMRDAAEVQRFNEQLAKSTMKHNSKRLTSSFSRKTVPHQVQKACVHLAEEKLDEYKEYIRIHSSIS